MTVKKCIDDGLDLAMQGNLQEAALSFCQAIKLDPDIPEPYQRLGEVLIALDCWDEAEKCFCKALELNAQYAEAHNYLGVVLKHKNCLDEAIACYQQAIQQNPNYAEAFHNLGNCLKALNRFDEAETSYLRALELNPDLLASRFSLATLYLLLGRYAKGWKIYDSRLNWKEKFQMDIPIWQGEDLTGRKILLFYEQGFGDMLQFIRYAYKIAKLTETTVWIQKPLKRLLANTQNAFSVCTNGRKIDPRQFDFACSLFSLPAKLNLSEEPIASDVPYLSADSDIAKKWREKIGKLAGNRNKVGVVWAGNPGHSDDQNRSIAYDSFCQLFDIDGIYWVSLQVGKEHQESAGTPWPIFDCSRDLIDFAETAGVIESLDLVIAVDTAVAHLAGAMGKETWLLLPYRSDWRWGLESEKTPWYPAMRLFRQCRYGDWQEVVERVKMALRERSFPVGDQ